MNAVMQTRDGQCFQGVTFKRADKVCGLSDAGSGSLAGDADSVLGILHLHGTGAP